jgi:hypothetical protein
VPGTVAGHAARAEQAKPTGQSTIARIAANVVHRDLSVELVVLVLVGGAGVVLYSSYRNAAQAQRYVGRRRHNGHHRQRVHPVA